MRGGIKPEVVRSWELVNVASWIKGGRGARNGAGWM